jgi:hypothetical protein
MGFTLRIVFEGLVAFVPEAKAGRITAMNVLLIDAREPQGSSVQLDGNALMHKKHIPTLRVRTADVRKAEDPLLDPLTASKGGVSAWTLDNDDLEIVRDSGTEEAVGSLSIFSPGGTGAVAAGTADPRDFAWIPDLDRLHPNGLAVKKGMVGGKVPKELIARMRFTTGTFSADPASITHELYRFVPLPASTADNPFEQAAAGAARAIAAYACYETIFLPKSGSGSAPVTIRSKQTKKGVTLSPAIGSTVEVVLRNMPNPDNNPPMLFAGGSFVDVDYELMYRVAEPRVTLVPAIERPGGGGGGGHLCGTGRYAPIVAS